MTVAPISSRVPALAKVNGKSSAPWRLDLLVNDTGKPRRAIANVITMLAGDDRWALSFNELSGAIETTAPAPWVSGASTIGEWTEADDVRLVAHVERELGFSIAAGLARAAVEEVARRRSHHPIRSYLRSIRWDGEKRLKTWLATYLGAEGDPVYLERVGIWWLVSAVARAERPGCQADHVLVLEGLQGVGKSSAMLTLAGEPFFATMTPTLGEKDSFVVLRGRWIVELDELASLSRSTIERVKGFISARTDVFRAPYARAAAAFPRSCVFGATTNAGDYLVDATGARRFWPVRCSAIDIPALARDRDLLWAEAFAAFESGARWWPVAAETNALEAEQDARASVDPWEPIIASWADGKNSVTTVDVLRLAIDRLPKDLTRADEMRCGAILRRLGFERRRRNADGRRAYFYERPGAQQVIP